MKLRFWGGKNAVMGGGLLAEVLMWSREYEGMRAERRKTKDVERVALTAAETVMPIHEGGAEQVAAAHGTNNSLAEASEVAEVGNQDDALTENSVNVANSRGCEGENQAQEPASPAPSQASSIKSHHASEEAQLPEAAKSPAAPDAPSATSSAGPHHSPKEDSAEQLSTSPAPSKAPSARAASSTSVPPPPPNLSEGLAQSDKEESAHNSKGGAPRERDAVPKLRGGGPPSKEDTSTPTSKKDSVSTARLRIPNSNKNTASQGKEVPQQRPSPSSQRPSEPPTQICQSAKPPTSLSILSAPPTIPRLNISRAHSVRPESSASWQVSADPAAPAAFRSLGRNWEKARYQPGDPAPASTLSISTASRNIWNWDDGRARKQPGQASPKPDAAPLRCNRCGALCRCERERIAAQSKAPSQKTSASRRHATSQALLQKPAASRAPPQKSSTSHIHAAQKPATSHSHTTSQKQVPPKALATTHTRPQSQLHSSDVQNQHSSRSYHETLSTVINRSQEGHCHPVVVQTQALLRSLRSSRNPVPTHSPSKISSQQIAKPQNPTSSSHGTHSLHASHTKSQFHTASKAYSHTSSAPKSQPPSQSQTPPNAATLISVPRPIEAQQTAVLHMGSTSQAQQARLQAQVPPQHSVAVVRSPQSASAPAQQPRSQSRTDTAAPMASTQQQPRCAGAHSTSGHSFVISWGHGLDSPEGTGSMRLRGGDDESDHSSSTSSGSDMGGAVLDFSGGRTGGDGGWH